MVSKVFKKAIPVKWYTVHEFLDYHDAWSLRFTSIPFLSLGSAFVSVNYATVPGFCSPPKAGGTAQ
jgi:hypothetical protein